MLLLFPRSEIVWRRGNRSAKPWSPSAVRGRRSEQNRGKACDCRHLQPRPALSHHGLTEKLRVVNPSLDVGLSRY